MKKKFNFFRLCLSVLLAFFAMTANAQKITLNGLVYTLDEKTKTAAVTGCDDNISVDVVIPASIEEDGTTYMVTSLGYYSLIFTDIETLTIPSSVTDIKEKFEYNESLTSILVAADNPVYCSVDGILFNKAKTALLCYPAAKSGNAYDIPERVTTIGAYAFSNCSSLVSIRLPDGVTAIGDYAFCYCRSLVSIEIPDGVDSLKSGVLLECNSLSSVKIGGGVKFIGEEVFWGCTALRTLNIPDSVKEIGKMAFYNCTSLVSISVDAGNTSYCSIDGVLFSKDVASLYCYPISRPGSSYDIPRSVNYIAASAFEYCDSLTTIVIPEDVTMIDRAAFKNCTGITSITLPNSLRTIEYCAFWGCTGITSVTIPGSVQMIGISSFGNCTGLTSVTIAKGVKEIDDSAFGECTNLVSLVLPNSLTAIGYRAFENCTSLISVTIPDSVKKISSCSFSGCTGLTSVTIPNSVELIGSDAFEKCSNLRDISIENPETELYALVFDSSANAKIYIPKSREDCDWSSWTNVGHTLAKREQPRADTLNMAKGELAARYYHYPVDIPEGVEAYTGELDGAKTKITLTKLETAYVPAGTPVLLYATATGEKVLAESSTDAYEAVAGNDLCGSITPSNFGEAGKALLPERNKADNTKYCFYQYADAMVPANRAYLTAVQVGENNAAKGIDIAFASATDVGSVVAKSGLATTGADRVYTLDGSYEPNPQNGVVYIVNGKKVIYIR